MERSNQKRPHRIRADKVHKRNTKAKPKAPRARKTQSDSSVRVMVLSFTKRRLGVADMADIKITVNKILEKIHQLSAPVERIKIKEHHLHHEILIESGKELLTWFDEKSTALQVVHRVAAKLGFVERPYSGEGRLFRYYEAR